MTLYEQHIMKFRKELFPKEHLVKQVIHAKLYIDGNYAEKLELKDIAGEAYFSKFHFLKLFKKIYGLTPYQYLKGVRIQNAKTLLKSGKPVADVAFSIGFDSTTSFTGCFKKLTGLSPSLYQKKQKLLQAVAIIPLKYFPPKGK